MKSARAPSHRRPRKDASSTRGLLRRSSRILKLAESLPQEKSAISARKGELALSLQYVIKQLEERHKTMVVRVSSRDVEEQLKATKALGELFRDERGIPLKAFIKCGVVSQVVKFLEAGHSVQLQLEAARVLTILGSHCMSSYPRLVTEVVIEYDLVEKFVDFLNSPDDDIRAQAVLALGHFAARDNDCRDHVLHQEDLLYFLGGLEGNEELSMLRSTSWTLLMFYKDKLQPAFEQVKPALTALRTLVCSNEDEVLINACGVLCLLFRGKNDNIQDVIDADVCQRLLDLLTYPSSSVFILALRAIGNIVFSCCILKQQIIDRGVLHRVSEFLLRKNIEKKRPKIEICKTTKHIIARNGEEFDVVEKIQHDACRIIAIINKGNNKHIQAVIDAGLIAPLVELISTGDTEPRVKHMAAWAISIAITDGTDEQIKHLVTVEDCLKPMCDLLKLDCLLTITVALEGLVKVMESAKRSNFSCADKFLECDFEKFYKTSCYFINFNLCEKACTLMDNLQRYGYKHKYDVK
ncbi:importin subunit alpha-1a-like isoform X2 [Lycium ferocissimum]|uniref:importin subunit alpha-1a-like isoform X2 n=1 Tax=Lycium ferocissimum TaxID=112874 RepID=UPI00281686D2|nr:importin subunit alpha-1a-like isoform X2 [Lycium ferocissimum]